MKKIFPLLLLAPLQAFAVTADETYGFASPHRENYTGWERSQTWAAGNITIQYSAGNGFVRACKLGNCVRISNIGAIPMPADGSPSRTAFVIDYHLFPNNSFYIVNTQNGAMSHCTVGDVVAGTYTGLCTVGQTMPVNSTEYPRGGDYISAKRRIMSLPISTGMVLNNGDIIFHCNAEVTNGIPSSSCISSGFSSSYFTHEWNMVENTGGFTAYDQVNFQGVACTFNGVLSCASVPSAF